MHERSLIMAVLSQVRQIQSEHSRFPVKQITVEVGPLSGVEPELLRSAYDDMTDDAALVIREVPLTVLCHHCGNQSSMWRFASLCPQCQSTDLQITSGDEFRLIDVTLIETTCTSP